MKLNTTILTLLIFSILSSCSTDQNKEEERLTSGFCLNEMSLFESDETKIQTDFSLFNIRTNTEEKLVNLFVDPFCNNLKLNIIFKKDSISSIPMTLNIYYVKDCEPPEFTPRLFCHILINKNGKVMLENQLCDIDSIDKKIIEFYSSDETKEWSSNNNRKVFISILWDQELEEKNFANVIDKVLKGYIEFSEKISLKEYKKLICDLNSEELSTLNDLIPFNLRTDFYGGFENIDYLPEEILETNDFVEIE